MPAAQTSTAGRTAEERRAYIDTARRLQPLPELRRKALKANRRGFRRVLAGVEGADLSFAEWWHYDLSQHQSFVRTFAVTFCGLCYQFAPEIGQPVPHTTRCRANPVDDGPYPGFAAARRNPAALAAAKTGGAS